MLIRGKYLDNLSFLIIKKINVNINSNLDLTVNHSERKIK
jgi:hypothetical protein